MPTLNYKHLRYFWAVAHQGNLTRAAEQLNVSQSALSVQIQKLEEQLDHALFDRRGKQMILTEAGRIALDHADTIFAAGDELLATLAAQQSAARHVLRVGAISTLSRNFQLQFLRPVMNRPDVRLDLRSGNFETLLSALEEHRLDVVLSNVTPPRDGESLWLPHLIDDQPISLIGTSDRYMPGGDIKTLLGEEALLLPSTETAIRAGVEALADRLGVTLHIAAEVDDMALLRLLTREGAGLAVVPPIILRDELANGTVCEVAALPGLHEAFYAITLSRRFPNPLLRRLLYPDG